MMAARCYMVEVLPPLFPPNVAQQMYARGHYTDGSIHDVTSKCTWGRGTIAYTGTISSSGWFTPYAADPSMGAFGHLYATYTGSNLRGHIYCNASVGTRYALAYNTPSYPGTSVVFGQWPAYPPLPARSGGVYTPVYLLDFVNGTSNAVRITMDGSPIPPEFQITNYTDITIVSDKASVTFGPSIDTVNERKPGGLFADPAVWEAVIFQVQSIGGPYSIVSALTSISISPTSTSLRVDETVTLTTSGYAGYSYYGNLNEAVDWTSYDAPGYMSDPTNGIFLCTESYEGYMGASCEGKSTYTTITGLAPVDPLVAIEVQGTASMNFGAPQQFIAIGHFTSGTTRDITNDVSWGLR